MRVVFVLIALVLSAACQAAGKGATDRLHPCQIAEGPPDAYCGTYRVFEQRAAASGRTIDLKIVVAPALRRDPKPDPLFVFEGGPGGGAATLASERLPMFRHFQTDRDIVLIDQRGTGESNPLDCESAPEDEDDLSTADTVPVERFRRCLAQLKADVSLYTTSIAMDDIDEVRRHLGYDQINRLLDQDSRLRISRPYEQKSHSQVGCGGNDNHHEIVLLLASRDVGRQRRAADLAR